MLANVLLLHSYLLWHAYAAVTSVLQHPWLGLLIVRQAASMSQITQVHVLASKHDDDMHCALSGYN